MWIALNEGWLSIVNNWNDEETLLVRARKLEHLTNVFPRCDHFKDYSADYPYRAYIEREEVGDVIKDRLMEIDYTNFKNSVEDNTLKGLYGDMWLLVFQRFLGDR